MQYQMSEEQINSMYSTGWNAGYIDGYIEAYQKAISDLLDKFFNDKRVKEYGLHKIQAYLSDTQKDENKDENYVDIDWI